MSRSGLLLDERLVSAHPSLVRRLGVTRAIVLQQINWNLSAGGRGEEMDGEWWYPATAQDLAEQIGVSADTIQRAVRSLEEEGLIVSCQPEGHVSRRKWYRVDRTNLTLGRSEHPDPSRQSAVIPSPQLAGIGDGASAESSSLQTEEQELTPGSPPLAVEAETESRADRLARTGGSPRGDEKPAKSAKPRSPEQLIADRLTRAWWESFNPRPRPAGGFPAVRKMVEGFARDGWTEEELAVALRDAGRSPANWKLTESLERGRGQRRRLANEAPASDRSLPSGRVEL